MWGSVEMGVAAVEDDHYQGMLIAEDLVIIEPVDDELHPIKPDEIAKKLIITNLFNYSLPLIRYVVDDAVAISDVSFSSYKAIKKIVGRTDDWFIYDAIQVHPMVFRHVLGQYAQISEYQVQQTKKGAHIRIIANDDINLAQLKTDLELQHFPKRMTRYSKYSA